MSDVNYAEGLYYWPPKDGAPDFVVGQLSISKARFISWLNDQLVDDKGFIGIDVTKQKSDPNKWSFKLDTWKRDSNPEQTRAPGASQEPTTNAADDDDSLPF